uniref:Pherophorin domain-containing protein n=1 Tax=Tetradesmus obliquus TaxID=3088 RepID=A0A383V698_TETOB|eukprot:jgi/Sobl393_1/14007/SZX61125.1
MLRLLLLLALVGAVTASVVQLDVCNMHARASSAPSMALSIKDGMCTVSSMAMAMAGSSSSSSRSSSRGCAASSSNEAVVLSFACKPRASAAVKQAVGPAVNVWASIPDTPLAAAAPNAALAVQAAAASCNLTTLNPGLYFHRSPPLYLYGYSVQGLPCQRVQKGLAAMQAAGSSGAAATQSGLWLLPSRPAPPKDFSTTKQSCHLVLDLAARSYISNASFPCSMTPSPFEQLGAGCCYDPPRRRRQ